MGIEWGFAGQVGGVGFGTVFLLLVILAGVIWLVGRLINKTGARKGETSEEEKGD